jgi:hypothetical protein
MNVTGFLKFSGEKAMEQENQFSYSHYFQLLILIIAFPLVSLFIPTPAWAFIPHSDPREAFFIRQFSYLFWAWAMLFFIFALSQENLRKHRGFRWLVWSAIFFALWNIDCFIGQFIALNISPLGAATFTTGDEQNLAVNATWRWFFSITKLDHLLLVPAFLCFYLGIRAFVKDPEVRPS